MSRAFDADLLVVGLGPAGDMLSGLARDQGLSVIAIDSAADIYPLPRAAVFDHEIMRIFQMLGVAGSVEPLCEAVQRYQFHTATGEILLDFAMDPCVPVSGWAEAYALDQPQVERALRERLRAMGADLRLSTRFVSLEQDDAGVRTTVVNAAGEHAIRSRFVVGCDGASSAVRAALGVGLDDYRFDEPWLVVDTLADAPLDLPNMVLQICDPRRPATFMRMGERRYRWEFMIKPGEDAALMLAPERIAELLAPWNCLDRLTLERKAVYRFHGLVAQTWRVGRVLLAGDAAHQMPPFAGQGMCSSIRDAANLAWKLAAVTRNEADSAVLDTYQIEREPHVRAIIETAIAMGRVVCLLDERAAAGRDAEMLAARRAGKPAISLKFPDLAGGLLTQTVAAGSLFPQIIGDDTRLDDVLGAGPWLICRHEAPAFPNAYSVSDPLLSAFSAALTEWLDHHAAEAVLIRPDRVVFGAGAGAALARTWRDMLMTGATKLAA